MLTIYNIKGFYLSKFLWKFILMPLKLMIVVTKSVKEKVQKPNSCNIILWPTRSAKKF